MSESIPVMFPVSPALPVLAQVDAHIEAWTEALLAESADLVAAKLDELVAKYVPST